VLKGDPDREITGVNSLAGATPSQVSLYLGGKYRRDLEKSRAGALLVAPGAEVSGFDLLEVQRPKLAFASVISLFHPQVRRPPGIHPTAVVAEDASIGPGCSLAAGVTVGAGVVIGPGTEIHEGTVIYEGVTIGAGCIIYARVVIREGTRIGDRVILHPGVVLGADGFGYEPDDEGVPRKIPQVGRVVLEDDVEVGANTCIDRSAFGETRVGMGSKIDNLCQIGHGVKIGRGTAISGAAAIGGSTVIGDQVVVGGSVGMADHIVIGDRALVAGGAGVTGNVPAGEIVAGFPHTDLRTWKRAMILLYRQARRD
jgi:UDP-3-O-[3-hydroxymyristoyl] glucosamine N-acyltransferase